MGYLPAGPKHNLQGEHEYMSVLFGIKSEPDAEIGENSSFRSGDSYQ